jgi:hypothetical protein
LVGRLYKEGTGEILIIKGGKGKKGRLGYYFGYTFPYFSGT